MLETPPKTRAPTSISISISGGALQTLDPALGRGKRRLINGRLDGYLDRGTGLRFSFGNARLANSRAMIEVLWPPSSRRFVRDGLDGQEIVLESDGVGIEQMLDAFVAP